MMTNGWQPKAPPGLHAKNAEKHGLTVKLLSTSANIPNVIVCQSSKEWDQRGVRWAPKLRPHPSRLPFPNPMNCGCYWCCCVGDGGTHPTLCVRPLTCYTPAAQNRTHLSIHLCLSKHTSVCWHQLHTYWANLLTSAAFASQMLRVTKQHVKKWGFKTGFLKILSSLITFTIPVTDIHTKLWQFLISSFWLWHKHKTKMISRHIQLQYTVVTHPLKLHTKRAKSAVDYSISLKFYTEYKRMTPKVL